MFQIVIFESEFAKPHTASVISSKENSMRQFCMQICKYFINIFPQFAHSIVDKGLENVFINIFLVAFMESIFREKFKFARQTAPFYQEKNGSI